MQHMIVPPHHHVWEKVIDFGRHLALLPGHHDDIRHIVEEKSFSRTVYFETVDLNEPEGPEVVAALEKANNELRAEIIAWSTQLSNKYRGVFFEIEFD